MKGCAMNYYAHSRKGSDSSLWQSVEEHLESVSAITARLAVKIGMPRAGELVGLVHDLGKYSQAFQQYLRSVAGDPASILELRENLAGPPGAGFGG